MVAFARNDTRPPIAEANAADAVGCDVTGIAEPFIRGADIVGEALLGESFHVRHRGRKIVITHFEAGRGGAMKKFRGDGDVTFARDSLRDIADVGIDAEGFLENQHSGKRSLFFGTGDECLHRTAVNNRQRMFFGRYIRHAFPFKRRWSLISQTIV